MKKRSSSQKSQKPTVKTKGRQERITTGSTATVRLDSVAAPVGWICD
jgi:hypothetical protein